MDPANLHEVTTKAISAQVIEIRIRAAAGKRRALYRPHGTTSKFWHYMPVRQAEKALRDGVVSIGLAVNAPVVAAEA